MHPVSIFHAVQVIYYDTVNSFLDPCKDNSYARNCWQSYLPLGLTTYNSDQHAIVQEATSSKFCCVLGCLAQSCSRNCQYSRLPEFYKPISWVKSLEKGRLEMFRRVAPFRSCILMIGSSARIEALHLVGVTILLHGSLSLVSTVSEQKCIEMLEPKDAETDRSVSGFACIFAFVLQTPGMYMISRRVRILLDCNGRYNIY